MTDESRRLRDIVEDAVVNELRAGFNSACDSEFVVAEAIARRVETELSVRGIQVVRLHARAGR